jgi:hypothetical protein
MDVMVTSSHARESALAASSEKTILEETPSATCIARWAKPCSRRTFSPKGNGFRMPDSLAVGQNYHPVSTIDILAAVLFSSTHSV